ncbi:hypothetical protein GMDG_05303 [Pseudogymnoascus destructans 20631-21]|uniref:Uncharacterized protein n=1 Tax=Pseudogymnoascus destructans (strain ATCC MYA-4855 / 20631-21) TaxID=658429 RepID=L8FMQ4_PSED2|nr:hypothetical protein GMDG_05303 [Pseudogymnoascus destructans 20631-21]
MRDGDLLVACVVFVGVWRWGRHLRRCGYVGDGRGAEDGGGPKMDVLLAKSHPRNRICWCQTGFVFLYSHFPTHQFQFQFFFLSLFLHFPPFCPVFLSPPSCGGSAVGWAGLDILLLLLLLLFWVGGGWVLACVVRRQTGAAISVIFLGRGTRERGRAEWVNGTGLAGCWMGGCYIEDGRGG